MNEFYPKIVYKYFHSLFIVDSLFIVEGAASEIFMNIVNCFMNIVVTGG